MFVLLSYKNLLQLLLFYGGNVSGKGGCTATNDLYLLPVAEHLIFSQSSMGETVKFYHLFY